MYGKPSFKDDIPVDAPLSNVNEDFESKVIWGWRNIAAICDVRELLRLCRVCRAARIHLRWHSASWQSTTMDFFIADTDVGVAKQPRFSMRLQSTTYFGMGPEVSRVYFFRQLLLLVKNITFSTSIYSDLLNRSKSSVLTLLNTTKAQPHCLGNVTSLKGSLSLVDLPPPYGETYRFLQGTSAAPHTEQRPGIRPFQFKISRISTS